MPLTLPNGKPSYATHPGVDTSNPVNPIARYAKDVKYFTNLLPPRISTEKRAEEDCLASTVFTQSTLDDHKDRDHCDKTPNRLEKTEEPVAHSAHMLLLLLFMD